VSRRIWQHGMREKRGFRWWLHWDGSWCLGIEAYFASSFRAWGITCTTGGDERSFSFSVHCWPVSLYVNLSVPWTLATKIGLEARESGITLSAPDFLQVKFRADVWGDKGIGFYRSWFLLDHILGHAAYRPDPNPHPFTDLVVMPERSYRCSGVIARDSWKRRLWFRQYITRAHVDMAPGDHVPVPGKGENSWDIDEDGIYGMICAAATPEEACAAIRKSAMRDRERYGSGEAWRPSESA
jgi:hypothetical protein